MLLSLHVLTFLLGKALIAKSNTDVIASDNFKDVSIKL
jgi:hypothetical protein